MYIPALEKLIEIPVIVDRNLGSRQNSTLLYFEQKEHHSKNNFF